MWNGRGGAKGKILGGCVGARRKQIRCSSVRYERFLRKRGFGVRFVG